MYNITPYSYEKAKYYDVKIKPSTKEEFKIDVYDMYDNFLCSIGATGYEDYPTYIQTRGKEYADERKRLYYKRHSKDKNLKGLLAKAILW